MLYNKTTIPYKTIKQEYVYNPISWLYMQATSGLEYINLGSYLIISGIITTSGKIYTLPLLHYQYRLCI